MEILLVRHGETNGNLAHRHQSNDSHLTPAGRVQANLIAKRLKRYKPTHLVSSHLVRAVDTAKAVGIECNLVPEICRYFAEIQRPSQLVGRFHHSYHSIKYYFNWYIGREIKSYTGGESYKMLQERVRLSQEYLEQYPDDAKIVVVSHSFFIQFFLTHLCKNRYIGPLGILLLIHKVFIMKNTGVVKLQYSRNSPKGVCPWRIVDRGLESL